MQASYYNPIEENVIYVLKCSVGDVPILLRTVLSLSTPRGRPTLEFMRDDESTLSLSTNGRQAFLVWIDSIGNSFHSIGSNNDDSFIFDYFGSYSEALPDSLVALDEAQDCVINFFRTGKPDTGHVMFEAE
jgi:hypothetical protein